MQENTPQTRKLLKPLLLLLLIPLICIVALLIFSILIGEPKKSPPDSYQAICTETWNGQYRVWDKYKLHEVHWAGTVNSIEEAGDKYRIWIDIEKTNYGKKNVYFDLSQDEIANLKKGDGIQFSGKINYMDWRFCGIQLVDVSIKNR
jgi:hypothetical protein